MDNLEAEEPGGWGVLSVSSSQLLKPGAALESRMVAPWTWRGITQRKRKMCLNSESNEREGHSRASDTLESMTIDSMY